MIEIVLTDEELGTVTGGWGGCEERRRGCDEDDEGRRRRVGENERNDFRSRSSSGGLINALNNIEVLNFGDSTSFEG